MALTLWQGLATDRKLSDKHNSLEMTRQDKICHWENIMEDTYAGRPVWSVAVVQT